MPIVQQGLHRSMAGTIFQNFDSRTVGEVWQHADRHRVTPVETDSESAGKPYCPFLCVSRKSAFKRQGKLFKGFSPEAEAFLRNHFWPGNVRQVKNAMERAWLF